MNVRIKVAQKNQEAANVVRGLKKATNYKAMAEANEAKAKALRVAKEAARAATKGAEEAKKVLPRWVPIEAIHPTNGVDDAKAAELVAWAKEKEAKKEAQLRAFLLWKAEAIEENIQAYALGGWKASVRAVLAANIRALGGKVPTEFEVRQARQPKQGWTEESDGFDNSEARGQMAHMVKAALGLTVNQ
jgi:hypothetical protein